MEVFAKVIKEDLLSGERHIAATAFLTFVALDEKGNPFEVPEVVPETDEEKKLHETGHQRAEVRKNRRHESKKLAGFLTTEKPWE